MAAMTDETWEIVERPHVEMLVTAKYERAIDDLQCLVRELVGILLSLRRGNCWCEKGIGNPMMTEHAPACTRVQKAIAMAYSEIVRALERENAS